MLFTSKQSINQQLTFASVLTLIKAIVFGILIGEIWSFSQVTPQGLKGSAYAGENFLLLILPYVFASIILVLYLYIRDAHLTALRLFQSRRFDVIVMSLLGLYLSVSVNGIGAAYYVAWSTQLSPRIVFLFAALPFLIILAIVFRAGLADYNYKRNQAIPFFISDVEIKSKSEDLLNFSKDSSRFAEMVLNGKASDSIVFGIDAPWGIGKSSFINFCHEFWNEKHKHSVIVYKFNALRFEDRSNLLEKFVDGLIRTIQKSVFAPELQPLLSRYSRLLKGKGKYSKFGVELELSPNYTVEDAFEDLESTLRTIGKKVIVVVDDLDRLTYAAIKDVLFTIKKSFTLPNISYVLCYDTDNIVEQEKPDKDAEKILEFLEKFINVKFSLFLSTDTLHKYVSANFDNAVRNNLLIDPYTRDQIKQTLSILKDIYDSPSYHHYQLFLGDVRKLKRLINTLALLEIEKTDFENSDIDKHDLIHLLLLYINYPNIFRKIYNTETDGKRGFFSAVTPFDKDYPTTEGNGIPQGASSKVMNSASFSKYLEARTPSQQFLLNQVFSVSRRLDDNTISNIAEEKMRSYACFNGNGHGKGSRNLEEYLHLIVRLSRPAKRGQYRFYLNEKDKLLQGTSIEDIFKNEEFSFSRGEESRQEFWRVIVNSAHDFQTPIGKQLIIHFIEHIPDYSMLENGEIGIGARDHLSYQLLKLLDAAGWADATNRHRNNTDENVLQIAQWIFGEGPHSSNGILDTLGAPKRGALGLYDLMIFRLYCCINRGNNFFNLQRALTLHGDPTAPTSGVISDLVVPQMRATSQRVFQIFKASFITPKKNFFDAVDKLTLEDLTGKYFHYVSEKLTNGEISPDTIDSSIASLKSRIKAFVIYQLGSTVIQMGIGCGYYDENGTGDHQEISTFINDYLFDQCFNPALDAKNYEHFVDYLLINFSSKMDHDGFEYIPTLTEFTKVLKTECLTEFWKTHGQSIKALNLTTQDKKVTNGNYIATYKEDLGAVFGTLDKLITSPVQNAKDALAAQQ